MTGRPGSRFSQRTDQCSHAREAYWLKDQKSWYCDDCGKNLGYSFEVDHRADEEKGRVPITPRDDVLAG